MFMRVSVYENLVATIKYKPDTTVQKVINACVTHMWKHKPFGIANMRFAGPVLLMCGHDRGTTKWFNPQCVYTYHYILDDHEFFVIVGMYDVDSGQNLKCSDVVNSTHSTMYYTVIFR